ncbi:aldehyde dehydrogenase family protein [Sediminitomix flava]|uniref:Aldehyde dehydrogenase (Acceptor) n=1 Tax=Sediminitomix flava TaxID=379075 RepID=A0A315ZA08_SEDFL|nr:aldehyde dehydrogenase family protein [Sediminitomix flava]PWJ42416.1 aldehyde dehydrogenase (acceptor) [Sediminitomix flava]
MNTDFFPMLQSETQRFLEQKHDLFIGGEWVQPSTNTYLNSINPANGEILSQLAIATEKDVDEAVRVARSTFENEWTEVSAHEKANLIWKLADLMQRDRQVFIELECLDNGKPLDKATYDVDGAIQHFRYYAGWADKIEGSSFPVGNGKVAFSQREALGVVGLIVPWNFPLMISAWKLAPALACGNTCILKPAEQTSLTALYLGKLIQEAGFPKGVVNILTGAGQTGELICRHMDVDKISFTGSTAVGRRIMVAAAESNLKKVSLELGGKSPNVIFDDADLSKVSASLHWSSFYNSGQECTLGSRIYVQENKYDQVVEQLIKNAEALTIGKGIDNPDLGPLISLQQLERVMGYIEKGREEGGELLLGGDRIKGDLQNGYFLSPTIFSTKHDEYAVVKEEIFGPVVTVSAFKSFEEVVDRANDSNYGLVAGVWTENITKAHQFAQQVKAGSIWINGYDMFDASVPFGGFKESGIGKEMGKSAIELYTQEKAIWVALS